MYGFFMVLHERTIIILLVFVYCAVLYGLIG